jgi:hypothetical protein
MSGSPVYVGGRLLGALAFGWSFQKEPIGGVTPFVRMEDLADDGGMSAAFGGERPALVALMEASAQGQLGGLLADWLLPDEAGGSGPLPVAVTTAGAWSPGSNSWLGESWRRLGWMSVPGGVDAAPVRGELRPGAMVAGVMVDGDVVLAAGGTVTEIRGDRVWAFGHPFLGGGAIQVPMARARVLTVMPSQMSSFKFFAVGESLGSFVSDRSRGISGRLGDEVAMIPVQVEVDERRFDFRSVRHPALTPFLVAYVAQGSHAARGRLFGDQSIDLRIVLQYAGYEPVSYSETLSSADAPSQAAALVAALVGYLENSSFPVPELEGVSVTMGTEERLRNAELVDVIPERRVVRPGDVLPMRLRLRPYRGPDFTRELSITVPHGTPDGRIDLVVADGASWTLYDLGMRPLVPGSFADELRLIEGLDPSTSVVAAFERRQTGVSLTGGSVAMPPSLMIQLQSGVGQGVDTTSYSVISRTEKEIGMPVAGAERIELQVRAERPLGRPEVP